MAPTVPRKRYASVGGARRLDGGRSWQSHRVRQPAAVGSPSWEGHADNGCEHTDVGARKAEGTPKVGVPMMSAPLMMVVMGASTRCHRRKATPGNAPMARITTAMACSTATIPTVLAPPTARRQTRPAVAAMVLTTMAMGRPTVTTMAVPARQIVKPTMYGPTRRFTTRGAMEAHGG